MVDPEVDDELDVHATSNSTTAVHVKAQVGVHRTLAHRRQRLNL